MGASVEGTSRAARSRAERERREVGAALARADRELAAATASARLRTARAIAAVVRQQRGAGARRRAARTLRIAWSRVPRTDVVRLPRLRGPVTAGGVAVRTIHFALNQVSSGAAAAAHQRYIERDQACVVSFGTIADTLQERCRLWEAIEERGQRKQGSVRLEPGALPALKRALLERVEGVPDALPAMVAKMLAGLDEHELDDQEVFVRTTDAKTHAALVRWLGEEDRRLREDGATRSAHPEPSKRLAWLPAGLRERSPRATIVQRRIVLEMPHELAVQDLEDMLRRWCREHLEAHGIAYHAVVHAPERGNDPRNFHAHVVYAPIGLERERSIGGADLGRWTFEDRDRLPEALDQVKRLAGNGPQGRTDAREAVTAWRRGACEVWNAQLRRRRCLKRYDARSYRAMGIDRIPGEHLGPARAALERPGRDGAQHWRGAPGAWEEARAWIESTARGEGRDEHEIEHWYEWLEGIRVRSGLVGQPGVSERVAEAVEEMLGRPPASDDGEEGETRSEVERRLRAMERELARAKGAERPSPQWLKDYEQQAQGVAHAWDRGALGRRAVEAAGGVQALGEWLHGARLTERDRRTVQGLVTSHERHRAASARWRERAQGVLSVADAAERGRQAAALRASLAPTAVALEEVLEPEQARAIAEAGETYLRAVRAEALGEALRTLDRMAGWAHEEQLRSGAKAVREEHERALHEAGPEMTQGFEERLGQALAQARVRAEWWRAREAGEAKAWLADDGHRASLAEATGRDAEQWERVLAAGEEETLARHTAWRAALAGEASPGALWEAHETGESVEPSLGAAVTQERRSLERRLAEACRAHAEGATQAERVGAAVRALGAAGTLARAGEALAREWTARGEQGDEALARSRLSADAERFAERVRRALRRPVGDDAERTARDAEVARACDAPGALWALGIVAPGSVEGARRALAAAGHERARVRRYAEELEADWRRWETGWAALEAEGAGARRLALRERAALRERTRALLARTLCEEALDARAHGRLRARVSRTDGMLARVHEAAR